MTQISELNDIGWSCSDRNYCEQINLFEEIITKLCLPVKTLEHRTVGHACAAISSISHLSQSKQSQSICNSVADIRTGNTFYHSERVLWYLLVRNHSKHQNTKFPSATSTISITILSVHVAAYSACQITLIFRLSSHVERVCISYLCFQHLAHSPHKTHFKSIAISASGNFNVYILRRRIAHSTWDSIWAINFGIRCRRLIFVTSYSYTLYKEDVCHRTNTNPLNHER